MHGSDANAIYRDDAAPVGPSAAVGLSNAQRAAAMLNPSLRKNDLSLQELDELYVNLDAFLDSLRECRGSKVLHSIAVCHHKLYSSHACRRMAVFTLLIDVVNLK